MLGNARAFTQRKYRLPAYENVTLAKHVSVVPDNPSKDFIYL